MAELHETNDRHLWQSARQGIPLWKGESFDQYEPDGKGARICPVNAAVLAKVRKPGPGAGSIIASEVPVLARREAVLRELSQARIAFHDVTQKDNSRTVVASLVPPNVFLTNKAPYLAFAVGDNRDRAACLGIMNSLPFDWQARRFTEVNLNFFILEGLVVPDLGDEDFEVISRSRHAFRAWMTGSPSSHSRPGWRPARWMIRISSACASRSTPVWRERGP